MKCSKCGESLKRAMLFAMLVDAGAKINIECSSGGEHDFKDCAASAESQPTVPQQPLCADGAAPKLSEIDGESCVFQSEKEVDDLLNYDR